MPKYTNTKQFIQPIMIEGKRLLVRPNQTIQTSKAIDLSIYSFLELAPDDREISNVAESKNQLVVDKAKEDQIAELKTHIENLTKKVEEPVVSQDILQRLETVEKRQKVLKDAIDTLNTALSNLESEVYFNGTFVIEDENK